MKILVTGATGFIGSAFCEWAAKQGHTVAGLVRPGSAVRGPGLAAACFSGTLERPPWKEIEQFAPEACVHAAWIATPGVYLESPENELYREWSLRFLERLPALGVRHITALGTCIEYQLSNEPLSEGRTPLAPQSAYARAKHALHTALKAAFAGSSAKLCWARVFYPFGIGEHPARLCTSLIQSLGRGETVTLKTPNSTKDYIYIEDLARALLIAVEAGFNGALNIGTGQGVRIGQIAECIAEIMRRPELVKIPLPGSDVSDSVVADATRLRSLGWKAEVPLRTGLERLVRNLRP